MCSGSRLVARITRFWQAASSAATSAAAASDLLAVVQHQQEPALPQRAAEGLPQRLPVPSRARRAPSRWSAGRARDRSAARDRRSRRHRDSGPRTPAATASARWVLPVPPAPVSVTRRTSSCARRSQSAATSASRPIRRVGGSGSEASGAGRSGSADTAADRRRACRGEQGGAIGLRSRPRASASMRTVSSRGARCTPRSRSLMAAHAQPRALGQLLLGEGRRGAQAAQQIAERRRSCRSSPPCLLARPPAQGRAPMCPRIVADGTARAAAHCVHTACALRVAARCHGEDAGPTRGWPDRRPPAPAPVRPLHWPPALAPPRALLRPWSGLRHGSHTL